MGQGPLSPALSCGLTPTNCSQGTEQGLASVSLTLRSLMCHFSRGAGRRAWACVSIGPGGRADSRAAAGNTGEWGVSSGAGEGALGLARLDTSPGPQDALTPLFVHIRLCLAYFLPKLSLLVKKSTRETQRRDLSQSALLASPRHSQSTSEHEHSYTPASVPARPCLQTAACCAFHKHLEDASVS